MRRVLFTALSFIAITATTALAADLPRGMPPTKAPAFVPGFSWTGFYAGINGGYAWGSSNWDGVGNETDINGGLVGLTVGYNWQTGPFVLGLEGDIDWTHIRGNFTNAACFAGCETRNNWLGTARGRIGYAFDRVMPYITGGAAFGDIEARPNLLGGVSTTNVGWTAGGGIEAAVYGNLTAKLEYLYVDLGSVGCAIGTCGLATNVDFRTNIVRAGLNYKF